MKTAVEFSFTGATTPISSYDPTKTNLGTMITQKSGVAATDKYAGPYPISIARPMEAPTAISCAYPHVVTHSSTIDYVFFADIATAAATRRVVCYEFNKVTFSFTWLGFITVTFPTATAHTIRALRVTSDTYSTGSVSVSGSAVTGSGTSWSTAGYSVGSRIGFGSTDPSQITTWYEVSSVADGFITLLTSAPTLSSGTAYVLQEMRAIIATTNATATNGGLFVVKGLHPASFISTGRSIPAATTTDNIRACYWLADAATVGNTLAAGLGLDSKDSDTQHWLYCLDGSTTSVKIYKYNLRAPLTDLNAGKSTAAISAVTGFQATIGNVSQANNSRIATTQHGPGAGVKSFYFVTTTRVYRVPVSSITQGSFTYLADSMVEIPPGSVNTFAATGALSSIEYSSAIDRFVVMSTGAASNRSYVTRYNANSEQFDHVFLSESRQLDQSTSDSGTTPFPSILASVFSVWVEGGIMYLCRVSTSAAFNIVYAIPVAAHWTFAEAANQRLITPALSTSGATKLYKLYVNEASVIGSQALGVSPEPCRVYVRTAGITDNSGSWTLLDDAQDLSGITPGTHIQFMFEFRVLGQFGVTGRVYGLAVTYEDASTDSHYQPSVAKSSVSSNRFAWRQSISWGGTIPTLSVKLFNAATGASLLTDTTVSAASGTWHYSTNGTTWNSWSTAADAVGNYIRYTANSLPAGVTVRAVITQ